MRRVFAGIGSRETPLEVCAQMTHIAEYFTSRGFSLRSGGARGADSGFEQGAGAHKDILRARDATPEMMAHAEQYHPRWDRCTPKGRQLHGRNSGIILGRDLKSPVDFVICWTEGGELVGGTAQGIRVAKAYDIPVFNLGAPEITITDANLHHLFTKYRRKCEQCKDSQYVKGEHPIDISGFCSTCWSCLYMHSKQIPDPDFPIFECLKCGERCFWD